MMYKRPFDIFVSLAALLILAPVMAVSWIAAAIDTKSSGFFTQKRIGRYGKPFSIIKLRTMSKGLPKRISRFGAFLRQSKIDELPQLFNVLSGDMSIVGPRPALPRQIEEYDEHSRRRLLVRPGLTGLAQVNGNTYLSWPERWDWDVAYVERMSLGLDVAILLRTIGVVLRGEERFLQRLTKPNGVGT